jgi:hypothetical protein
MGGSESGGNRPSWILVGLSAEGDREPFLSVPIYQGRHYKVFAFFF